MNPPFSKVSFDVNSFAFCSHWDSSLGTSSVVRITWTASCCQYIIITWQPLDNWIVTSTAGGTLENAIGSCLIIFTFWTFPSITFVLHSLPLLVADQSGRRLGNERSSPCFVQCVMQSRTGTSTISALPVQNCGCQKCDFDQPEIVFCCSFYESPFLSTPK